MFLMIALQSGEFGIFLHELNGKPTAPDGLWSRIALTSDRVVCFRSKSTQESGTKRVDTRSAYNRKCAGDTSFSEPVSTKDEMWV